MLLYLTNPFEEKWIFPSKSHVLVVCSRKTQPNQTRLSRATPEESKQPGLSTTVMFVCMQACVYFVFGGIYKDKYDSLCRQKCLHMYICMCLPCLNTCLCVCAEGETYSLCLKVFPCVSNYYSVGGHTKPEGMFIVVPAFCVCLYLCVLVQWVDSVGQGCLYV